MKKILTLSSNAFLWINPKEGIIYNSNIHKAFEFTMTEAIYDICEKLLNIDNLYSVEYDDNEASVRRFIDGIESINAGKSHLEDTHFLSLPPVLNLQHSIEMQSRRDYDFQDFALRHLSKVKIYTGGKCVDNIFYKQIDYPINSEKILNSKDIINWIKAIRSQYLTEVSLCFSDISEFVGLYELLEFLSGFKFNVIIYVRADDNYAIIREICRNYPRVSINVLYHPGDEKISSNLIQYNVKHTFLISSEAQYYTIERLSNQYNDVQIETVPIFNGKNYDFFKRSVFLSKEDILSSQWDKKDIFMHQVLNVNNFGILYLMPNKKIYSDINQPELGSICDSIYDLIIKELSCNYSWRWIRNNDSCQKCLYRYLCPSPTSYERVMNIKCICTNL